VRQGGGVVIIESLAGQDDRDADFCYSWCCDWNQCIMIAPRGAAAAERHSKVRAELACGMLHSHKFLPVIAPVELRIKCILNSAANYNLCVPRAWRSRPQRGYISA
jgi:hypothetical protein